MMNCYQMDNDTWEDCRPPQTGSSPLCIIGQIHCFVGGPQLPARLRSSSGEINWLTESSANWLGRPLIEAWLGRSPLSAVQSLKNPSKRQEDRLPNFLLLAPGWIHGRSAACWRMWMFWVGEERCWEAFASWRVCEWNHPWSFYTRSIQKQSEEKLWLFWERPLLTIIIYCYWQWDVECLSTLALFLAGFNVQESDRDLWLKIDRIGG